MLFTASFPRVGDYIIVDIINFKNYKNSYILLFYVISEMSNISFEKLRYNIFVL